MTLVATEVSGLGIVMIGDSAVTHYEHGIKKVWNGASKVQYASSANVGFAMWGGGHVDDAPADLWLSRFIGNQVFEQDGLADVCERLAATMNAALSRNGAPDWNRERRGIHVAGYVDGLPHIYHLHTGAENEPQHELRVFKDVPFGVPLTIEEHAERLRDGLGSQLRNGAYRIFGSLFDAMFVFTNEKLPELGFEWPRRTLEDRVSLYTLLVDNISRVLLAEGRLPRVGGEVAAIGFTERGLAIDCRIPLDPVGFPCGKLSEAAF
jgi:hypothetical protein